ncbi:MAG TPA: tyrosine-type recombinase/integrase [Candidatus Dormibacteraeota bacterium]|nr:tyrosine-type recombinase/integrase [Candidatus Dormibacteraeota bacterium]
MKHRDKVILSREEAASLLRAARGARLEAALVLGVTTGMREGEILGLRRQDLDLDGGILQVEKNAQPGYSGRMELGSPKTAASRRTVVLPQVAVEALRAPSSDRGRSWSSRRGRGRSSPGATSSGTTSSPCWPGRASGTCPSTTCGTRPRPSSRSSGSTTSP